MTIECQTAIETIAANEWTGVVVDPAGSIVAVIGLDSIPSVEELDEISKKYSRCAFQFLPRGNLSHQELEEVIKGLVEVLEYSQTHEMRPGVNIPSKSDTS